MDIYRAGPAIDLSTAVATETVGVNTTTELTRSSAVLLTWKVNLAKAAYCSGSGSGGGAARLILQMNGVGVIKVSMSGTTSTKGGSPSGQAIARPFAGAQLKVLNSMAIPLANCTGDPPDCSRDCTGTQPAANVDAPGYANPATVRMLCGGEIELNVSAVSSRPGGPFAWEFSVEVVAEP